ncbi:YdcH family protein [Aliiglaciecola sp. LCG003]|uniref:YdcH family protein n=1 Tax=Aliiglaciecola sp. LCG003 TaxID=3053655 RepID=UPI00257440B9|nr:YdcH family protein [Aliiglaciecola sp. LCG003]WJG10355.1 YdcH family protein [Aliiglaciecola sp. LCG003]
MQLEKHTLLKDFPDHHHTIRHLKMNDNHFAKLFDQYHELDSEIHHLEEENAPVADDYLESLKKRRLNLKDQLFSMIQKTESEL